MTLRVERTPETRADHTKNVFQIILTNRYTGTQ